MSNIIKVVVSGAYGRMGREVMKAVLESEDLNLIGAVDIVGEGTDIGSLIGCDQQDLQITSNLENLLKREQPDVLVDFSIPDTALKNSLLAVKYNTSPIIGTTGLSQKEIEELCISCDEKQKGAIIASNFAIGAILMMRFAKEAAKFFPNVEVIEMHHDKKLDAPSGTALTTVSQILEERKYLKQGHPDEFEKIPGARGAVLEGVHVHSVRLPGYVAHQEVIFGGLGQILTIRHDAINRESFMPGVLLAIRKVMDLKKLVFDLDSLI